MEMGRDQERERERETDINQLSPTCALPGIKPTIWLGIKTATFWCTGRAQLNQPGHTNFFKETFFSVFVLLTTTLLHFPLGFCGIPGSDSPVCSTSLFSVVNV